MAGSVMSPGRRPESGKLLAAIRSGLPARFSERPLPPGERRSLYMQIQRLLLAGIPVSTALKSLEAHSHGRARLALARMSRSLGSGSTLAEAARAAPSLFAGSTPALLGAAEKTGTIPAMLQSMVRLLDVEIETRKALLQASLYPIFLVASAALLLPLPALMTCGQAGYLRGVLSTILPFVILTACLGACRFAMFDERVHAFFSAVARRIPLVGRTMRNRALANSLETMGLAVQAGLGISESLALAASSAGDPGIRSMWMFADTMIRNGGTLAASLDARLPDDVAISIATGEKTGNLADALLESAQTHFKKYQAGIRLIARILTGILLAVIVAIVAKSILQSFMGVLHLDGSGDFDDEILREIPGVFNQMPH